MRRNALRRNALLSVRAVRRGSVEDGVDAEVDDLSRS